MSIGQQLQAARQAASLSIEDVALATHIRIHYLEALEEDNLEIFPSMVQVRGFLRAYAAYLKLDAERMLTELEGDLPEKDSPAPLPESHPDVTSTEKPDMAQSQAIFVEVGEKLRVHREVLGFSLKDVERQTHIRVHYLEALENGDLGGLPSPVQGRGMLSNYAVFLGLDPDPLLLRYADGLQARLAARQSLQRQHNISTSRTSRLPASRPSPLRRILNTDLIVGSILVVFLIAFTAWGALRISAMRSGEAPTPTSPSIAEVLLGAATETSTLMPSESASSGTPEEGSNAPVITQEAISPTNGSLDGETQVVSATLTLPAAVEGPLQVSIIIQQRAWMRVVVDEEVQFEERVQVGGAYSFSGEERIEVLTGNGAALRLYFNQEDLGIMGSFGEVAHWIFTLEGMQTPTATLTPIGQPTSTGTPTPLGGPASTPTLVP